MSIPTAVVDQIIRMQERIVALERERDELRPDAMRYRRLRDLDHWPAAFDSHSAPEPLRGPELDAAIDAMKETPWPATT